MAYFNTKKLIRIGVDACKDRIEFRRQFSGWSYVEFLSWLYQEIFKTSPEHATITVKAKNQELLQNFAWVNFYTDTDAGLQHIRLQNQ